MESREGADECEARRWNWGGEIAICYSRRNPVLNVIGGGDDNDNSTYFGTNGSSSLCSMMVGAQ